jgi:signal transduction histidine kinase
MDMQQRKILVIDNDDTVHYDFRRTLESSNSFDLDNINIPMHVFSARQGAYVIDSAYQDEVAITLVKTSLEKQERYALVFIGSGVNSMSLLHRLLALDADLQFILCSSINDEFYEELTKDNQNGKYILILKKPYEPIELQQLVASLMRQWELDKQVQLLLKQQKEQLNYFFREADFLYQLSQLSQTEFSTREAMQLYVNGICLLRDWPMGHIYRAERNEEDECVSLFSTDIWYLKQEQRFAEYQKAANNTVYNLGEGLPGRVLDSRKPQWIEHIKFAAYCSHGDLLIHAGIRGALALPIKLYDTVIAVVEFFSEQPIVHNQQLLDLTSAAANQLGLLLQRRSNEKALNENYMQLQTLYIEMQNTQAQLLQHAKLVSIGQLAAGVAHEINNPIAFVMSNIEVLKKYLAAYKSIFKDLSLSLKNNIPISHKIWSKCVKDHKIHYLLEDSEELINDSLEGLVRVKDIVSDLKSFSHTDEAEIQEADINHCLDVTLKMIWNELKYKCTVVKNYEVLPLLRCYPRQLNQVFLNLLVNSGQAIETQGEIKITTKLVDDAIKVIIEDNGEGISQEIMQQLFDPFFTTKPVGTGTGLGLSISYNIIKKHSGTINVESEGKGKGARFTLTLPLNGVN